MTTKKLAETLNYSEYHFAHSFREHTGLSVSDYIRRQRLSLAAADLLAGISATENAMKYGFDTASGFSKAFRRYYGMSPHEYKSVYSLIPKPSFQSLPKLQAIVYLLTPPDDTLEFRDAGAYWCGKDFSFSNIPADDWAKLLNPEIGEIGAWIPEESSPTGLVYAFGPIVADTSYIPEHMHLITLPAAKYAVYEVPRYALFKELSKNIVTLWNKIYEKDFVSKEYLRDESKIAFELYRGPDTYIYIPILEI